MPRRNCRRWISSNGWPPVKDQGRINSCVAQGIAAAYEFDGIKTTGNFAPISRLYLYKAARGDWVGLPAILGPASGDGTP